jgi:hypothetical protein
MQTTLCLWGTLSPKVRADRAALRDDFVSALNALPGLKLSFGEQLIRAYQSGLVMLALLLRSRAETFFLHGTAGPL